MLLRLLFTFCIILFINLFSTNLHSVYARSRCAKARGKLFCPTDPDRHFNVLVKLLDKDPLPWESDDVMGTGYTDEFGNFTIHGCADDFGAWNDPDPLLFIMHRCPEPGHTISIPHRFRTVPLERKYMPDEIEVPLVRLDHE